MLVLKNMLKHIKICDESYMAWWLMAVNPIRYINFDIKTYTVKEDQHSGRSEMINQQKIVLIHPYIQQTCKGSFWTTNITYHKLTKTWLREHLYWTCLPIFGLSFRLLSKARFAAVCQNTSKYRDKYSLVFGGSFSLVFNGAIET